MAEFDYVIVGAGSAGCTLANRLSEDPTISVCLIEAGKKDSSFLIRMPAGVGQLIKEEGPHNWGFWTEPQTHMDGRKLWWPRGKGWGGSSSINGMIYIRGHARDYDQWRQMGLDGWGFADVLPYFRLSEHYEGGSDDFHGSGGPLWVENSPLDSPVFRAFIQAGREAGHKLTDDFNGPQQEGFGPYQRTIRDGERWSASFAYLRPVVDVRDNLTVVSTGLATRILLEQGRAMGVEVVSGRGKMKETISAGREVIVCAGAVQSPQLLMLSGIGPADEIKAQGLKVEQDVPEIGKNLQDHLDVLITHEMTQPLSVYQKQKGLKKYGVALNYLMRRQGAGRDQALQAGAFLKSRIGLDRPDIQLHMINALSFNHAKEPVEKDGFMVHACQLRPESRGTITLGSPDPFDPPKIDPNYLAEEEDRRAMRESVKMVREVLKQNALSPYRGAEITPGESVRTDEEIDAFVRRTGETIYHPVGTVRMGVDTAAPLDSQLRLKGVDGLRVIDASVMPTLIGGNTNAPTIMIAEKAADMILGRPARAPQEAQLADAV
ncbi:MAG: choline dehydrogenase [Pseudomonadota bacterium]